MKSAKSRRPDSIDFDYKQQTFASTTFIFSWALAAILLLAVCRPHRLHIVQALQTFRGVVCRLSRKRAEQKPQPDRDAVWSGDWYGPKKQCIRWGTPNHQAPPLTVRGVPWVVSSNSGIGLYTGSITISSHRPCNVFPCRVSPQRTTVNDQWSGDAACCRPLGWPCLMPIFR